MKRGLVVLLIVSAFCGAAVGTYRLQTKLSQSLRTTQVSSGRILAIGTTQEGAFRIAPVEAGGTLPDGTRDWDFYLTDEQLRQLPRSVDKFGEVWVDTIETHNSRRARTVKLTVANKNGVTVCIYEGARGKVIPKQRSVLAQKDLRDVVMSSLLWCLASALLTFIVLLSARTRARRRGLKNEIPPGE